MKKKISLTLDDKLIAAIRLAAKQGHRNVSQEFEKALMPIYLSEDKKDTAG
jgi:hypothetical protein